MKDKKYYIFEIGRLAAELRNRIYETYEDGSCKLAIETLDSLLGTVLDALEIEHPGELIE